MNPEEGDLRAGLLDKFGLYVNAEGSKDILERINIIKKRLEFEKNPIEFSEKYSEDEELLRENLIRRYYNSDLNAYLRLQVRFKSLEAKRKLADCKYIVAVNIDKNREEYIVYASAKSKSGLNALVAFSDLAEFEQWRQKFGQKYKPLEVDFLGLQRLGGRHGFLINPLTSKFYLSPELIDEIRKFFIERIEERKKMLESEKKG